MDFECQTTALTRQHIHTNAQESFEYKMAGTRN